MGELQKRLRMLVSRIELVPNGDELAIVLRGDLAAILTFASGKKNPDFLKEKQLLEGLLDRAGKAQNHKKPRGGGFLWMVCDLVAGARNYRCQHSVAVEI